MPNAAKEGVFVKKVTVGMVLTNVPVSIAKYIYPNIYIVLV
jgi:hypothetical protein